MLITSITKLWSGSKKAKDRHCYRRVSQLTSLRNFMNPTPYLDLARETTST
jgi:hypothetical protein